MDSTTGNNFASTALHPLISQMFGTNDFAGIALQVVPALLVAVFNYAMPGENVIPTAQLLGFLYAGILLLFPHIWEWLSIGFGVLILILMFIGFAAAQSDS